MAECLKTERVGAAQFLVRILAPEDIGLIKQGQAQGLEQPSRRLRGMTCIAPKSDVAPVSAAAARPLASRPPSAASRW